MPFESIDEPHFGHGGVTVNSTLLHGYRLLGRVYSLSSMQEIREKSQVSSGEILTIEVGNNE